MGAVGWEGENPVAAAGGLVKPSRADLSDDRPTVSSMESMAKDKVSITVDQAVLANADADAKAAGLSRSEMVEQALRHEHLRIALRHYTAETVPALGIDAYAEKIYRINQAAEL